MFEKSKAWEGAGDDKVTRRQGVKARTTGGCAERMIAMVQAVASASSPCPLVALSPCRAGAWSWADHPSGADPAAAAPRWKARNNRTP